MAFEKLRRRNRKINRVLGIEKSPLDKYPLDFAEFARMFLPMYGTERERAAIQAELEHERELNEFEARYGYRPDDLVVAHVEEIQRQFRDRWIIFAQDPPGITIERYKAEYDADNS